MQIYLVGGAVRDDLLGLPIQEKDWVVVGASPEELQALGFQPVGKDFPVFLHPETHEEYALARTERKIAKGYTGFKFYANRAVTLDEDLSRRDLTINAMALDEDDTLIDPFNGQADLENKVLRHVSPAFQEDPVRILRAARFAAKLVDFHVHPQTKLLMKHMVELGEVDALKAERVWKEMLRALEQPAPVRFFQVLIDCCALPILFPAIATHSQCLHVLAKSCRYTSSPLIRFAALMSVIDEVSIRHLCQHYRVPREYLELALAVANWHKSYEHCLDLNAIKLIELLKHLDAIRRPRRLEHFIQCCGSILQDELSDARSERLRQALQVMIQVDTTHLQHQRIKGKEFAEALLALQKKAIDEMIQEYKQK